MKEHPIIFSTDMVKTILDGRKTQTRRPLKIWAEGANWLILENDMHTQYLMPESTDILATKCPYGQVGDRLWVRESFWIELEKIGEREYTAKEPIHLVYFADNPRIEIESHVPWSRYPSIHMPRWASRLTLEITEIRVERLQEISVNDLLAEGIETRYLFENYWNELNAKRGYGWEKNPWVWVIGFAYGVRLTPVAPSASPSAGDRRNNGEPPGESSHSPAGPQPGSNIPGCPAFLLSRKPYGYCSTKVGTTQ